MGVLFEGCLRHDAVERLAIEDIARLLGPSSWGSPGHTEEPVPAMYQAANTGATAAGPEIFGAVPTKAVPVPTYAQLTVPAAQAGPPVVVGKAAASGGAYGVPGPAVSAAKSAGNGGAYGVPGPAVSAGQAGPTAMPALVENPAFAGPPSTVAVEKPREIDERRTNTLHEHPPQQQPATSNLKGASLAPCGTLCAAARATCSPSVTASAV